MKLAPVYPATPVFYARCCVCDENHPSTELDADNEGKPFVDYYCKMCAEAVCDAYAASRKLDERAGFFAAKRVVTL